ncbi:MAG: hypothetical protein LBI06_01785 [Treponema sp.]|jgi:uncharacterized membrane protein YczE|nr:hypothetical protein [Treponema sp.]
MSQYRLKYFCREYFLKALLCITGVFIIGIGVGFMRYADFGIDPYMCFMNGLHITIFKNFGISFGATFAIASSLMVLIVLILDRSKIGLGTIAAIVLTGYVSDLSVFLCNFILLEGTALFVLRIGMMAFGILLVAIGSGMYFNTHVGVSPYDAIGLIITNKIGNQNMYRWVRIGTDLICVGIGFFMGNMPGVGTIIMAFFTGPLFAFFRNRILVWGKELRIITW